MAISVRKTIPASSDYYTTGGDQTITLAGTTKVILHTKKALIKIIRRKTKSRQTSEDSDKFDNKVIDTKNGTDDFVIGGWIEDEDFPDSTCDTTLSSTTITCDASSNIAVAQNISGTGIPVGSVVLTVNVPGAVTSFTISIAATATNSNVTLNFTDTAWEKYWRLRAMNSRGGPLTSLVLENITFDNTTQEAFLEEVTGTVIPNDTGVIDVLVGKDVVRIELVLTFFIGDER